MFSILLTIHMKNNNNSFSFKYTFIFLSSIVLFSWFPLCTPFSPFFRWNVWFNFPQLILFLFFSLLFFFSAQCNVYLVFLQRLSLLSTTTTTTTWMVNRATKRRIIGCLNLSKSANLGGKIDIYQICTIICFIFSKAMNVQSKEIHKFKCIQLQQEAFNCDNQYLFLFGWTF